MNNKWGMIKTDGTLWHGPETMIKELEKKGWLYVVNPKRSYYQEYDKTHPNYTDPGKPVKEIDVLNVDVC